jgi:hypothetical protein
MKILFLLILVTTYITIVYSKCDVNTEIQTISNKMNYSKNKLISSLYKSIEYEDDIFFNKSMKIFLDEMNLLISKLQKNVSNIITLKMLNECTEQYSLSTIQPTKHNDSIHSITIEQFIYYSCIILIMLLLECIYFFVLYKMSNRNIRIMIIVTMTNLLILYIFVKL